MVSTPPSATRYIPTRVKQQLRREVGFGCPIPNCGNPYLEYHHFDPPWHVEQHNDPLRMIALCATHHAQAEAWTPNEIRDIKRNVDPKRQDVQGRFQWMKDDVLAIAGGNYYYEESRILVFHNDPILWFTRDERNRLLISFRMLSAQPSEPRATMDRNDWSILGSPTDVVSPPGGKLLKVSYANGDSISVEFKEWESADKLAAKHPIPVEVLGPELVFPLVTAEMNLTVGGTDLALTPTKSSFGNGVVMTGCVSRRNGTGVQLG